MAPTNPGNVSPIRPNVDPEYRPGSIGPGQLRKIMAAIGKLPRDERLARVGELAGRAVESTNDLSYAEAQKVLAGLGEMNKGAGS